MLFRSNKKNNASLNDEFIDLKKQITELTISFNKLGTEKKFLILELERLKNIVNATNIGTWEWEIDTGKVVFNEKWANLIGYTLEELAPTNIDTWYDHSYTADLVLSKKELDKVFKKELKFYEQEVRMKHKNGKCIWLIDKGEVIKWSPDGKPLLMVGSHTDITDRKSVV